MASRACSAQPRNISCTERLVGLIKLAKKCRMPTVMLEKKVDIPKRRDDEMHIFLRTSSSAVLESSILSMAHHRSTSRSGLRVASLEFTGLEVAHRMHGRTQDRERCPRNDSCRALSHVQAGDPQMAPCLCITCALSVL